MTDIPALLVDGRLYREWTSLSVTRSLGQVASSFEIGVARGWNGMDGEWPIRPFQRVELRLGDDVVLTGHIDTMDGQIEGGQSGVSLSGRSLTADLVDCMPAITGTEFRRSTLPAIARAIAARYAVDVVEEADCGAAFALERFKRTDTCWDVIERLCRMRSVLGTDDATGRLVLTRAGARRASGGLVLGQNIVSASAELSGAKRFSDYLVLSQSPSAASRQVELDSPDEIPNGGAQSAINASARDPDVSRYRLRVMQAEGDGTAADARARAVWAATTARAQGLSGKVRVAGWRQPDGRLWQVNEVVPVQVARLQMEGDLLVKSVTYALDAGGRSTTMTLTPPAALTPEPLTPARKPGGAGSSAGAAGWIRQLNPIR